MKQRSAASIRSRLKNATKETLKDAELYQKQKKKAKDELFISEKYK
tara:strand:- start:375 stop:512 length:138 start_codon:yes stop_codon:yes gene_type:complete